MTPLPAGRGAELYEAVLEGDKSIAGLWAEWDRLPSGGVAKPVRDNFSARLHGAQDHRASAASACWAYFAGPEATAEERAAWALLDPSRWRRRPQ